MTSTNLQLTALEAELKQQTAGLSGPMLEACRYALEGGRRTRAMLLLALAQGSESRAILASAAVEMIHAATLLQDDIFDSGELRRGRLVAHLRFGKPLAILASDWLLIRALEVASDVDPHFFRCLAQAGASMVQAEAREFSPVPLDSLEEAELYGGTIAQGKTAALFGTVLCGAAVLRELCEDDRDRWKQIGVQMGLTYQWVDDCVDLYGMEASAGKTIGHDLVAGCLTWPVLLAARSLAKRGTPISLRDLQAGHLPSVELQRLDAAVRSTAVMTQMHHLLQSRFEVHRREAAEAGLCGLAVGTWRMDLLVRLKPCFEGLLSRMHVSGTPDAPLLSVERHQHA